MDDLMSLLRTNREKGDKSGEVPDPMVTSDHTSVNETAAAAAAPARWIHGRNEQR
jgi:hypothetical protein